MPGMGHHLAFSKWIPCEEGYCGAESLALAGLVGPTSLWSSLSPCVALWGPCVASLLDLVIGGLISANGLQGVSECT